MLTWLLREAPRLQKAISSISSREYGFSVRSWRGFVFIQLAELLSTGQAGRGAELSHVVAPRLCSLRSGQGSGGITASSAPASSHGSSPHLQDTSSSSGCFLLYLLLPRASRTVCLPAHPDLPILSPQGFCSPIPQKTHCFGFI